MVALLGVSWHCCNTTGQKSPESAKRICNEKPKYSKSHLLGKIQRITVEQWNSCILHTRYRLETHMFLTLEEVN